MKRDYGEDLTPERWDRMIEHIRDWYSGEQYDQTPKDDEAGAEDQAKAFLYWDAMNLLEESLKRPLRKVCRTQVFARVEG